MKNIEKFLDRERMSELIPKYNRIVILSDSKGNYIKAELDKIKHLNSEVVFWAKPGRNTKDGIAFLTNHIEDINDKCKTIILFWHFTCDATKKIGKIIQQRYDTAPDLTGNIEPHLKSLLSIHARHEHIDIGILECPPIFTKEWNKARGEQSSDRSDDTRLNEQISDLNSVIRTYNSRIGFSSPKFVCDFIHRNKRKGKKVKETLNPILLKDGVHPIGIVAYKWLVKILKSISQ